MTPTMKSLGIDQLPIEQRIALVHEIWDSIEAENPNPRLTEAKILELRRRAADDDADPDGDIPWEQVEAAALARCRT